MTLYEFYIVFPDGEVQEITHRLGISDIVDINGNVLTPPLPTNRMLAYHVSGMRTSEERGLVITKYMLEQFNSQELFEYI